VLFAGGKKTNAESRYEGDGFCIDFYCRDYSAGNLI